MHYSQPSALGGGLMIEEKNKTPKSEPEDWQDKPTENYDLSPFAIWVGCMSTYDDDGISAKPFTDPLLLPKYRLAYEREQQRKVRAERRLQKKQQSRERRKEKRKATTK